MMKYKVEGMGIFQLMRMYIFGIVRYFLLFCHSCLIRIDQTEPF